MGGVAQLTPEFSESETGISLLGGRRGPWVLRPPSLPFGGPHLLQS